MTEEDFELHHRLVDELRDLKDRRRFAFMAVCLERVAILSRELIRSPLHPEAIEHLWERASGATAVRSAEDLEAETAGLTNDMQDEGVDDFTISVAQAFEAAMHVSAHPTDDEATALVASNASDAMAFEPDSDASTRLINEETEAQLQIVRGLQTMSAEQLTPSGLARLRRTPPWHERFLELFGTGSE